MLMESIKILVLLFSLISLTYGSLAGLTLEDVYQDLLRVYDEMDYYQADFEQSNYWPVQEISMESEGRVYIEGEQFALIYSRPSGQRLIIDRAVYLIDENDKNLIITDIEHTDGLYKPVDILRHYWEQSEKELISSDEDVFILILIPENDPCTSRVEMDVRKHDYLVKRIFYQDHQQNSVEFRFINEKIDERFSRNVFSTQVEDDYVIIDNR